jgi:hypothetical protein
MSNEYLWARIVGPDPNIRSGDDDRERIAERLRKSHAEGRLDMTEFQQRIEGCYEAKTLGELAKLVRDLPRQAERPQRSLTGWFRPWHWHMPSLPPVVLALIVISAATGHHVMWLWIPFVFLFWRTCWWRRRGWPAAGRRGPDDWI